MTNFFVRALCPISTDNNEFAFLFLFQELSGQSQHGKHNYVLITRTLRPRVLVIGDTPWATHLEIDVHFGSFLLTDKIRLILAQYKEMFIPSASPKNKKSHTQYTNHL